MSPDLRARVHRVYDERLHIDQVLARAMCPRLHRANCRVAMEIIVEMSNHREEAPARVLTDEQGLEFLRLLESDVAALWALYRRAKATLEAC